MTRRIHLSVPFHVQGPAIDDHAFSVLDELYDLGALDPDVYVDLENSCVTLELVAQGDTDLAAVKAGLDAIRTAIHAAGGNTHGWEEDFAEIGGLFPREEPRAEWERTETRYTTAPLVDA